MKKLLSFYKEHRRCIEIAFGFFLIILAFAVYFLARCMHSEFLFCFAGAICASGIDLILED